MPKAGWCRNYTGIIGRMGEQRVEDGRACKAGVRYLDVRRDVPAEEQRPGRAKVQWPCLGGDTAASICAQYDAVTADEEAAAVRFAVARLEEHCAVIESGRCPHCGNPMKQRRVGRCMYAMPCGHRLNQIPAKIVGL